MIGLIWDRVFPNFFFFSGEIVMAFKWMVAYVIPRLLPQFLLRIWAHISEISS